MKGQCRIGKACRCVSEQQLCPNWATDTTAPSPPNAVAERQWTLKLDDYREIQKFGSFMGVGGDVLGKLLDEIENHRAEITRLEGELHAERRLSAERNAAAETAEIFDAALARSVKVVEHPELIAARAEITRLEGELGQRDELIAALKASEAALNAGLASAARTRDRYHRLYIATSGEGDILQERLDAAEQARAQAEAALARVREALTEIAKGKGEFSVDPLRHASNAIDNMKQLAREALATLPPQETP